MPLVVHSPHAAMGGEQVIRTQRRQTDEMDYDSF